MIENEEFMQQAQAVLAGEPLQCIGCGALLQLDQPHAVGYIPAASLAKQAQDLSHVYCQRCFQLRHYNRLSQTTVDADHFLAILNHLGTTPSLVVHVIDLFDVEGSFIEGLNRFVGTSDVIVIGNKADLIPKSVKRTKLVRWLEHRCKQSGLKPVATLVTQKKDANSLEEIMTTLKKWQKNRDIVVVGAANVGKSTLLNRLLHEMGNLTDVITTSKFPGTTLDRIEIPLDDGHSLIDTPGIMGTQQISHLLAPEQLSLTTPQKVLRPKTFQLGPGQTLFLAGLVRLDVLGPQHCNVTCYTHDQLVIHRTKTERADEFWARHRGELLQPPTPEQLETFPEQRTYRYHTEKEQDLAISGLGWLRLPAQATVAVSVPQGILTTLREPLI